MPDNYIVLYNPTNNREAINIVRKAQQRIRTIAKAISNQEELSSLKDSLIHNLISNYGNKLFYKYFVSSKGFRVNDDCVHCLKCVDICPLNNIKDINKKIVCLDQCTHCMACINSCLQEAIEYKKKTRKRNHYHLHKIKDKI